MGGEKTKPNPKPQFEPASIARLRNLLKEAFEFLTGLEVTFKKRNSNTTFSDGCLGSHIDEERSEMRYVMRIAESSESSNL
jgi:hypothetical protein